MRLIDRNALIIRLDELSANLIQNIENEAVRDAYKMAFGIFIYEVSKEPIIDAEPIVRCRDCKWYENACTFFSADPFEQAPMEENGFCSFGERKNK